MHPDFDLPSPGSIKGRSSSITAAFIQSIVPVVEPTFSDVSEALNVLGMETGNCVCSYCGDARTEWDHFRPLVTKQRPTGYITEIANLVPACGKCNQSKGSKPWRSWITSTAKRSPLTRGVLNLDKKISHLEAYEKWREPQKVDFESLVGPSLYDQHWLNWKELLHMMDRAQQLALIVREAAAAALATKKIGFESPTPQEQHLQKPVTKLEARIPMNDSW
ncbi:HNH endonuclease [Phragmitibacter flavus]|uniref:HNH endonuclease n=1 Tax=Phragmitibacter flavus TaxID=2576071 RepID=A0A5R8KKJ8_9BACT|nr:HNH endonuclease [Phragmitibacter flavus]TLD72846.1 HNH endonuclease [Phragmitibacter flavus]